MDGVKMAKRRKAGCILFGNNFIMALQVSLAVFHFRADTAFGYFLSNDDKL
jgi:hypothetical protein